MSVATKRRGKHPPPATIEERVIEAHGPGPKQHLATQTGRQKIIATRWQDLAGTWFRVGELDGGLFAIFAADGKRALTNRFPFPWTDCEQAQEDLDAFALGLHWTPDPPLPVDDDEPKPTRRGKGMFGRGPGPIGDLSQFAAALGLPERADYVDEKGRVLFVDEGLTDGSHGTFWRGPNGSLHRVKSPHLPMEKTWAAAQRDLDQYAKRRHLHRATEPPVPAPDPPPPKFEHKGGGIWDAGEKWLLARGVAAGQVGSYMAVLTERGSVSIEWPEWQRRRAALLEPWLQAGFEVGSRADPEGAELFGTPCGVPVGVQFEIVGGIALHEVREEDPVFRESISETGYRHFSELDNRRTTPRSLEQCLKKRIPEHQAEMERKRKREAREAKRQAAAASKTKAPKPKTTALVPVSSSPHPLIPSSAPVTAAERRDLKRAETVIERNKSAFIEMGQALAEIRDRELFREHYQTWEQYLRERWGFGRAEAADKIAAAKVAKLVSPVTKKANLVLVEDHAKALAPLLNGEDESCIGDIYQRAVKRAAKEKTAVTGKILREERYKFMTPAEDVEKRKEAARDRAESRASHAANGDAAGGQPAAPDQTVSAFGPVLRGLECHIRDAIATWTSPPCRSALEGLLRNMAGLLERMREAD